MHAVLHRFNDECSGEVPLINDAEERDAAHEERESHRRQ